MSAVGEYEIEPVRGLPEMLPKGEEVLWQGSPDWQSLARRAFHTRVLAIYFALLVTWRLAIAWSESETLAQALPSIAMLVGLAALALGVLTLLAWLNARTTVYTITNRRVVMRFGVALTMAVNLPFEAIQSAGLRSHADGTGDIPLNVDDADRVGYLLMWPHVRPWKFGSACEPMLRSVPEVQEVSRIFAGALDSSMQTTRIKQMEDFEGTEAHRGLPPQTAAAAL